jgi:hypothetical protein
LIAITIAPRLIADQWAMSIIGQSCRLLCLLGVIAACGGSVGGDGGDDGPLRRR